MTLVAVVFTVLNVLDSHGPPWIPEKTPQEDHRVVHPLGYSIVKPPGWIERIYREDDGSTMGDAIMLTPTTNRFPRFRPSLGVHTFTNTPVYLSNYHETLFLQMKAYEQIKERAGGSGDYFSYAVYVTNRGRWYSIIYQIPVDSRAPPITS